MIYFRAFGHLSLGLFLSLFIVSGCSLFETSRRPLGQPTPDEIEAEKKPDSFVSKVQYDDLLSRYEALKDENEKLKETNVDSLADQLAREDKASPVPYSTPSPQVIEEINDIPKNLAETVDVFNDNKSVESYKVPSDLSKNAKGVLGKADNRPLTKSDEDELEGEILSIREGISLFKNKQFSKAMKVFQQLEKSKFPQIVVRAKFYIGELLFDQGEFDLSLQVYEDVIKKFAFSGLVIPSMRKVVACSKKLGLDKKRDQYTSMLKDFFDVKVI